MKSTPATSESFRVRASSELVVSLRCDMGIAPFRLLDIRCKLTL